MSAVRSWLYVPADRPDRLEKAAARGADALILDLEDAVAASRKDVARQTAVAWIAAHGDEPVELWVRVNSSGPDLDADLAALASVKVDGVLVAKATLATLARADDLLGGSTNLGALIETAEGVLDARAIAALPRVTRIALGEADLGADLGLDPSPDGREFWPHRAQIVLAAAAAGIEPPCAPVSTDFRDLDAFRLSTEAIRRAGFGSRSAIHPAQVAVINDVFTPSASERDAASSLLAAYREAIARGDGVFVDADGRMVDEAVIRSARRTLELGAGANAELPP